MEQDDLNVFCRQGNLRVQIFCDWHPTAYWQKNFMTYQSFNELVIIQFLKKMLMYAEVESFPPTVLCYLL